MLARIDDPLIAVPDEASVKAVFDDIGRRVNVKEWRIVDGPTLYLGAILQKGDDCYVERSKDGYEETLTRLRADKAEREVKLLQVRATPFSL